MLSLTDEYGPAFDTLVFAAPVAYVYNPLAYARRAWKRYIERYGNTGKRTLFLGMNPGPWGMSQTGIPFGEIEAVRGWMGIEEPIDRPADEHPKRPIQGFACRRSEVSGRRLWGLFAEEFETPERFFRDHLVINYCPLAFMAESGRNITPDKLPASERAPLFSLCDAMLAETIRAYRPRYLVGVGQFARRRFEAVAGADASVTIAHVLHPSPASPAANSGWAERARRELRSRGVWAER